MSSPYPVLDNRPIDQWKVTELKEELKRRKLTTKGLKDDLIKRLDEALRIERENSEKELAERERAEKEIAEREIAEKEIAEREIAEKELSERENAEMENAQMGNAENKKLEVENAEREKSGKGTPKRKNADKADNGFSTDPQPVTGVKDTETVIIADETVKEVRLGSNKNKRVDDDRLQVDINDPVNCSAEEKCEERDMIGDVNTARMEGVSDVQAAHVETGIVIVESVSSEVACGQDMQNSGAMDEKGNSSIQQENKDSKPKLETGSLTAQLTDDVHETSASSNQVSEVSPVLGFQVKSDSISTDSVSINKKIELKDNIIADNVKIEQDVVRPEMVQPSSSSVVPVSGELHPMDVEEPLEKKASVEEKDDENITNADASKKNDSADIGYSEKLNLDRSSGDDSMEDDVLESKQIDSKYNSDEVGNRSEKSKMLVVKDESPVDVVGDDLSTAKTVMPDENKTVPSVPAEKRKLHGKHCLWRFFYLLIVSSRVSMFSLCG